MRKGIQERNRLACFETHKDFSFAEAIPVCVCVCWRRCRIKRDGAGDTERNGSWKDVYVS